MMCAVRYLSGLIDKRVNKYFATGAAVVRKLEKDKYLAVFRYKYLEKLLADKFSILEDIKSVKIGNEMTLTLSIGIGTGADNYAGNYDLAKAAMDLHWDAAAIRQWSKRATRFYITAVRASRWRKIPV